MRQGFPPGWYCLTGAHCLLAAAPNAPAHSTPMALPCARPPRGVGKTGRPDP